MWVLDFLVFLKKFNIIIIIIIIIIINVRF